MVITSRYRHVCRQLYEFVTLDFLIYSVLSVALIRARRSKHAPTLSRWPRVGPFSPMHRQLQNDVQSLEFGVRQLFGLTRSADALGSAVFLLTIWLHR